ncbi:DUF6082 family protein [Nocardiopsis sediminis]|uniref:DUF6082 family protein n=1 Tax=Nocardiopsis sediminis TaxID=1778267 RepID=A0ABV8FGD3_9ACTN
MGITITLFLQQRDLRNQRAQLNVALEDQRRGSEIALRQIHTDIIKMAIDDDDLLQVWPRIGAGVGETKQDHDCNLVLNLQKVAYETRTVELKELRGALRYLVTSPHIHAFWAGRAGRALLSPVGMMGRTSSPPRWTRPLRRCVRLGRRRSGGCSPTRSASSGALGVPLVESGAPVTMEDAVSVLRFRRARRCHKSGSTRLRMALALRSRVAAMAS